MAARFSKALALVLASIAIVGGAVSVSGLVDPGADRPHAAAVHSFLAYVRERGIQIRLRGVIVPFDIDQAARVRRGASDYAAMCATCHASPSDRNPETARGLMPHPPNLTEVEESDAARAFWFIKHGVKMTGMPGWGWHLADEEIWDLVAFVRKLPTLTPEAYDELVGTSGEHHDGTAAAEHVERDRVGSTDNEHDRGHHAHGGDAPADHDEPTQRAEHDEPAAHDEHGGHSEHETHADHNAALQDPARSLLRTMATRTASGTAWQPDATPMHAFHTMAGPWMLMAHGNVFVMVDAEGSDRGATEVASVNWLMGHAELSNDHSAFLARAMLSLEPATIGNGGYPLVGQSGETYEGEPLHDRQHPHDLFMELALIGRQTFGDAAGVELYVAPAGEPALGPIGFPHRASAISDPVAPLGHHWQDATHITFGVLTAGVFAKWVKVEGSWFNGHEPDEHRWDLDLAAPDSWSTRLTVNPAESLSAQVSYGYLAEPELLRPNVPVRRVTASVMLDHDREGDGNWATTAVWGRNIEEGDATDAFLIESNLSLGRHVNAFGRAEYAIKSAHDLVLDGVDEHEHVPLTNIALGHVYTTRAGHMTLGIGVRGDLLFVPAIAQAAYGAALAPGGVVFVQARPAEARAMHGQGH